jgi:hypothetical protein
VAGRHDVGSEPRRAESAGEDRSRTCWPIASTASNLALATNTLARRIRLAHTLRKTITDALFGPGFIKTGIAVSGQTLDLENNIFDIGAPYADRVDPDDMILDPGAREWDEQLFVGNRFRVPKLDLLESGLYDNGMIETLCSRYDGGQFRKEASSLAGDANVLHDVQRTCTSSLTCAKSSCPRGRHCHPAVRQGLRDR